MSMTWCYDKEYTLLKKVSIGLVFVAEAHKQLGHHEAFLISPAVPKFLSLLEKVLRKLAFSPRRARKSNVSNGSTNLIETPAHGQLME
jgi:hypothetical protein